jgi:hypothetical protein
MAGMAPIPASHSAIITFRRFTGVDRITES